MAEARSIESQKATYQDVLDAPPHKVAEIAFGELHLFPRPAAKHAWASMGLGGNIGPPFNRGRGGPGGWWIVIESELHLGKDVLVPDFGGWRREDMPEYPDSAYFSLAPNWVCEVLSPTTRRFYIGPKRSIYAREGVDHLWFVDPIARTLDAFELREGSWVLLDTLAENDSVSLPPFDAITFSLGDLWLETRT